MELSHFNADCFTWKFFKCLAINDYSRVKIDASVAELQEEREAVRALGLI